MAEPTTLDDLLGQAQPSQPSGLQRLFSILGPALIGAQNPQAGLAAIEQLQEVQQQRQAQAMAQNIGTIGQRIAEVAKTDPAAAADLADRAALHFSTTKGFEGGAKQFTSLSERLREQAQSQTVANQLPDSVLKRMIAGGVAPETAVKVLNSQSNLFKYEVRGNQILKFDMVNPGARPQIVETLPTEDTVQSLGGNLLGVTPGQPGTLPLPGQATGVPTQPGGITERPLQQPAIQGAREVGKVGQTSLFQLPQRSAGTAAILSAAPNLTEEQAAQIASREDLLGSAGISQEMAGILSSGQSNPVDVAVRALSGDPRASALIKDARELAKAEALKTSRERGSAVLERQMDTPFGLLEGYRQSVIIDRETGRELKSSLEVTPRQQLASGGRFAVLNNQDAIKTYRGAVNANHTLDTFEPFATQLIQAQPGVATWGQAITIHARALLGAPLESAFIGFRERMGLQIAAADNQGRPTEPDKQAVMGLIPGERDSLDAARLKLALLRQFNNNVRAAYTGTDPENAIAEAFRLAAQRARQAGLVPVKGLDDLNLGGSK